MSADFRYMKCPRQTWFLVYTIPPDLRGHPQFMTANGKPMDKITESLGTTGFITSFRTRPCVISRTCS